MKNITIIDKWSTLDFADLQKWQLKIDNIHNHFISEAQNETVGLGWWNWPNTLDDSTLNNIKTFADNLRTELNIKYLVVIGVGGSSLGTWAGYQALSHANPKVQLLLAGNNLSTHYLQNILNKVKNASYAVCIVSKSGSTLEPAVAFRIFHKDLMDRYGHDANKRVVAITEDNNCGLNKLGKLLNIKTFYMPKTIGGRFSVLTAVGLVPLAICGFDIKAMINGARQAYTDLQKSDLNTNSAYYYAAMRYQLYLQGYKIEILSSYEFNFYAAQQWWQQLFGESEGKDQRGIFPTIATFTQDLHSLGQYVQSGPRNLFFETICDFEPSDQNSITLHKTEWNTDHLNSLANMTLHELNAIAMKSVIKAHAEHNTPQIILKLPMLSAFTLGYYWYWMMRAVAISGSLLGVEPFNQPGVEVYKNHLKNYLS